MLLVGVDWVLGCRMLFWLQDAFTFCSLVAGCFFVVGHVWISIGSYSGELSLFVVWYILGFCVCVVTWSELLTFGFISWWLKKEAWWLMSRTSILPWMRQGKDQEMLRIRSHGSLYHFLYMRVGSTFSIRVKCNETNSGIHIKIFWLV